MFCLYPGFIAGAVFLGIFTILEFSALNCLFGLYHFRCELTGDSHAMLSGSDSVSPEFLLGDDLCAVPDVWRVIDIPRNPDLHLASCCLRCWKYDRFALIVPDSYRPVRPDDLGYVAEAVRADSVDQRLAFRLELPAFFAMARRRAAESFFFRAIPPNRPCSLKYSSEYVFIGIE